MRYKNIFPLYVLHWHQDRIVLPSKAKLLAVSSKCREQFFRIGKKAYGLWPMIELVDKLTSLQLKRRKIGLFQFLQRKP